jgi:hypothetical protein
MSPAWNPPQPPPRGAPSDALLRPLSAPRATLLPSPAAKPADERGRRLSGHETRVGSISSRRVEAGAHAAAERFPRHLSVEPPT